MTGSGDLWWFAPGLRAFRQNEVGGGKISRGTWLEETWPRHCPSFREGFGRGLMARGEPPPRESYKGTVIMSLALAGRLQVRRLGLNDLWLPS